MTASNPTRREILGAMAAVTAAMATRVRASQGDAPVDTTTIRNAEWLSGLSYSDDDRELMLPGVKDQVAAFEALRGVPLDNGVPPAVGFDPRPAGERTGDHGPVRREASPREAGPSTRPRVDRELAYLPVSRLSHLMRRREITSESLTRVYLDRLREHDPTLRCVITLTDEMALEQARAADRAIAKGNYRGPLHGIPWGAKDLLAVEGASTTWGAAPFRDQVRPGTSTVAARLAEAGAVLVAKTAVGALAWGDVWFDATTKNPWNVEQGSSGSSAGSASGTAAGLLGFAIGTETWGSIVSPCTRCGATGLRPTFGRVSRHGVMALSWSMDKIGPIARTVEDAALVFDAIHGTDGHDASVVDRDFAWPRRGEVRNLRVGYVPEHFEKVFADEDDHEGTPQTEAAQRRAEEWREHDRQTLEVLRERGFQLVPIELPGTELPLNAMSIILTAEAATAFDELTRTGRDDELVRQVADAWPNVFRQGQMIPAVEYLRANRVRTLLMQRLDDALADVDVFVAPSFEDHLLMTNLTGHPAVVVPNGFRDSDGTPTSITFTGKRYRETDVLAVADAYQRATDFHTRTPPAF